MKDLYPTIITLPRLLSYCVSVLTCAWTMVCTAEDVSAYT